MGMMFKVKFSDGLAAIYVAELPFNRLRTQNLGSHELGVAWNIQYKDPNHHAPKVFLMESHVRNSLGWLAPSNLGWHRDGMPIVQKFAGRQGVRTHGGQCG